jgi:hypothetical protein
MLDAHTHPHPDFSRARVEEREDQHTKQDRYSAKGYGCSKDLVDPLYHLSNVIFSPPSPPSLSFRFILQVYPASHHSNGRICPSDKRLLALYHRQPGVGSRLDGRSRMVWENV